MGDGAADDVAQSFFLKMYERDILDNRPAITGKFRNWLYVAARRHAIDEWRKSHRRPERLAAAADPERADPAVPAADALPADADEFYALSILHMTVARVQKHLIEEGKAEHWMIFEELVLAPLIPGRVPKSREALWRCSRAKRPASSTTVSPPSSEFSGACFPRSFPLTPRTP